MNLFGYDISLRKNDYTELKPGTKQYGYLYTGITSARIAVTEDTALALSAVFSCVNVLSRSVASLPLNLYLRDSSGGRIKAAQHPLYKVLHDSPNPEMTAYAFRESMMMNLLMRGNAFAEIIRNGKGEVTELWPIPAKYIEVSRDTRGELTYTVKITGQQPKELASEKVLHIAGLGFDGIMGKSAIAYCKDSVSIGIGAEQFGAGFYANGAKLSGILKHPGKISKEAHERLNISFNETYSSMSKAQKTAILEEGMSYERIGIPPGDAQFIETRKFQVEDIARIFNVPLFLIQSQEKSTAWGSGIEQLNMAFVTHHLRPILVRWEQTINMKCLTDKEKSNYFVEFLLDGLLRGDNKTRYESYAIGRMNGWLSVNEIRALENMNAVADGDIYVSPLNLAPAGNQQPTQKALPDTTEKRDTQEVLSAIRPIFIDTLNRIIRRAKADLSRKLSKADIEANPIIKSYFIDEYPAYVLQSVTPIYAGFVAASGQGDSNVMSAEMTTRFTAELSDTCINAIEQSANVAASVDGALSAIQMNTATIADREINIVMMNMEGNDNAA
jgi:HK97 family phage portal protein